MRCIGRGVSGLLVAAGLAWACLPAQAQTFNSEGPAPSQGPWDVIQSRDLPNVGEGQGTVAGAIQAVLPDPTNPGRIFIGSTNGGIWRTIDNGTTWTPVSDNASSLSIASLSFDPTNANVIIAGIGNTSNGLTGPYHSGLMTGLLYSTNGGSTWSTISPSGALGGKSIVAATVRGNTILAASADPNNVDTAGGGLYISTDSGTSFNPVSGVPTGSAVTALAADSGSTSTFYASVNGNGIYKSVDGGANWSPVTIPISTADNLRVVTGSIAGTILVAAYNDAKVTGLALSKDGGATWSTLAVPAPNTGQTNTNLALAIDPHDANVVYLGGAASSADRNYTLAGYKIVLDADGSSTFSPITLDGTADNSAPHADARVFVFDLNGRMLMGGDGGIYAMTTTAAGASWTGLNSSTLSVREANAVAYDFITKRIVVAAQDTGVAVQDSARSVGYTAVQGADGLNAAVNDVTLRSHGQSAVYTSVQSLGGLMRQTYDSHGTLIGTQGFNTSQTGTDRLNFEPDDFRVPANPDPDTESEGPSLPHGSKIVLNRIDPTRIAFGTNYVYTTTDVGADSTTLTLLNRGVSGSLVGPVTALAFGTVDNPDAVLAASARGVYVSTTETGGSLTPTDYVITNQTAPSAVVFDTRFANTFYVADGTTLQYTANGGHGTFGDLTSNLTSLNIMRPLSLEFISTNGVNALLAGGLRTTETAQSPLAVVEADSTGALVSGSWRTFGTNLPNAMVSALAYNPSADALVVSLWGRGIWTLYDVTSYFSSATVLQFGLADNDSTPDPSLLTGARPLVKDGIGTLTITGPATYSGGTTLKNGTLLIAGTGTLGATSAATAVSAGTLDLGGTTQTQNGGLTLSGGTVQNGIFQSSGGFTLGDGVISAVLAGGGGLAKSGTGTVVLSGINTYTGSTGVTAGNLTVNGSIASSSGVTVGVDGTLGGSGTLPATVVNGFVAPNNPGGVLTVNDSFTQNAGSTYEAVVTAGGQSDQIKVNGTASLAGSVAVLPTAGAYGNGKTFTLLTATAITGSYGSVSSSYTFLRPTLSYDLTDVFVTLTPGGFSQAATTPSQAAVAGVLDRNVATASGDFLTVIDAFSLMTPAQASAAFQAVSGQNYSGFSSLGVQTAQLFMNFFSLQAGGAQTTGGGGGGSRVAMAEACEVACDATDTPRWSAWGGPLGGVGTIAGSAAAPGQNFNIGGFAAGIDRRFDGGLLFGVTAGYTAANQYTQTMPGQGSANTVQLGLYGEYGAGNFYLDALAGYAHSSNQMTRPISLLGLAQRTAIGKTTTEQFFGQLEAGYKIALGGPLSPFVTPFARLQGSTASQAGFTESGADSLDLTVAGQTTNSLRTVLGAQAGGSIDLGWREKLGLVLRLGWSHEYADTSRPVNASFAGAPASPFTVAGAQAPRDGAIVGLSASTAIAEATSLYLRYDGELAGGNTSHIVSAGLRVTW